MGIFCTCGSGGVDGISTTCDRCTFHGSQPHAFGAFLNSSRAYEDQYLHPLVSWNPEIGTQNQQQENFSYHFDEGSDDECSSMRAECDDGYEGYLSNINSRTESIYGHYCNQMRGDEAQASSPATVPQPVPSSSVRLQTNAEDFSQAPGVRESREISGNDFTNSEADSPYDSEDSSSALSHWGRHETALGIEGDLGFEDAEETSSTDTLLLAGTSCEVLLELPSFHRHVRRVLQRILQWQGFRAATHHQPESQSTTSANQDTDSQERQGPDGMKRRKEADPNDGADEGDSSSGRLKRARRATRPGSSRPFSCPFCKKDLQRYQACVRFELTKVRHVKQHLHRKHSGEIDEPMRHRLRKRSSPGTEEEQWYGVFDLLFPGHSPRPASPYNDFTVFERPDSSQGGLPIHGAVEIAGIRLTRGFLQTIQQSLAQNPAFANIGADVVKRVVECAVSQACAEQISHQNGPIDPLEPRNQQCSEGGNANSEESSNNCDSTLEQSLLESYASNDHKALQVQLEPMPNLERPQHVIDEIRKWEDLLNPNPTVGGGAQDQQLSLNSDTGLAYGQELDLSFLKDELPPDPAWGDQFDTNWGPDGWTDIDLAQLFGESAGEKVYQTN